METEKLNIVKQKTAFLSVISNTVLMLMKLTVGIGIGSISIISEAIHSATDLLAASIAFFSVRKSSVPPDDEHAFGHGKYEDFSGLIEGLLILLAAVVIVYEAVTKLFDDGGGHLTTDLIYAGILVMGVSAIINWYVSTRLASVAKKTDSIALESDAWHLRADVYSSAAVFAGLVIIRLTGLTFIDSLFAIGVAVIIVKAAVELIRRSYGDLLDQRLTDDELERIRDTICRHAGQYANFHNLRTRRSGPDIFIDFHLVVDRFITVEKSHNLADHLELDIKHEFPRASVSIHIEPCDEQCFKCELFCLSEEERKKEL